MPRAAKTALAASVAAEETEAPARVKWPADKVTRVAVALLVPYARNARTHSPEQVAQLARSIQEFGFTIPILVDEEGGIIAGHGRVLAAQKLGLRTIPAMVATGWSEKQKRAYVLADNQLALNADWDDDLLKIELTELSDASFDLGLTGFSDDQIAEITKAGLVGLGAGSEESASGAKLLQLKFGTKKVAMDETEQNGLALLLDRYVNDTGLTTGFVSWLLEGKHVG